MSQNRGIPDVDSILNEAWSYVVGGLEWQQSVIFGEFVDNRPLSAVVADMLVSFVPGVVIVTSARDAVAIILRLANHPEKREELMEWVLLCACLITIALPIAMAVGGALVVGAGAVVGGIAGSELGAVLRAVMLMLIKKAQKLIDLVQFLQKFIKGDVLKFLRAVKFVQYEKSLLQALSKITGKLVEIVKELRKYLEGLRYFDAVKAPIAKLAEWESKFYNVQQDALRQIPKALIELDVRLVKVLGETVPKEAHTVSAGVQVEKGAVVVPQRQKRQDTAGKILPRSEVSAKPALSGSEKIASTSDSRGAGATRELPMKDEPEAGELSKNDANTKKQAVTGATVAADRERISQLSKEGKIIEARSVLQPYVDAAKNAKTVSEREDAMNAIIQRLDVTSPKEKSFWSGNKDLARKIAKERGKIILEETPGGKVIDEWDDLNEAFPWDGTKMAPHGWDFWGEVSSLYSRGAVGEIDVIQDFEKSFPSGGPTWRGREWPTIVEEGKVTVMNILGMDKDGKLIEAMKVDPYGSIAEGLFGGKLR